MEFKSVEIEGQIVFIEESIADSFIEELGVINGAYCMAKLDCMDNLTFRLSFDVRETSQDYRYFMTYVISIVGDCWYCLNIYFNTSKQLTRTRLVTSKFFRDKDSKDSNLFEPVLALKQVLIDWADVVA